MEKKGVITLVLFGIFLFNNLSLVESRRIATTATVTVNPLYNLSIDIDILNEIVHNGENLSILIELEKEDLSNISKEISVDLNYEIIRGKKIIESNFLKTVNITDKKEVTVNISISQDLRGAYNLKIIASNPQSNSDDDKDRFRVTPQRSNLRNNVSSGRNSFFYFIFDLFGL